MILTASCLLLAGCSVPKVPKVIAPTAEVTGATLTEQTAGGAAVAVTVDLSNPNDFALPVTFEAYRISVGGKTYAFKGKAGASMPPNGTQTLTLTGAVPTEGEDMRGAAYTTSGSFTYVKPGEIRRILVESGLPEPTLGFEGSGNLQ